jgi:hypothetical protein
MKSTLAIDYQDAKRIVELIVQKALEQQKAAVVAYPTRTANS